jgi:hypothetical protein
MKVAIAGSRRLPKGHAPLLLVTFMAKLPDRSVILLRRSMGFDPPGAFEADVSMLAAFLRFDVEWFRPEPTAMTTGRASVYRRDIEMVERSDLVILFFAADEVAEGYGGTQHLLDKALDANRPCYAYSVDEFGTIDRVGEYDPDHQYADMLMAP